MISPVSIGLAPVSSTESAPKTHRGQPHAFLALCAVSARARRGGFFHLTTSMASHSLVLLECLKHSVDIIVGPRSGRRFLAPAEPNSTAWRAPSKIFFSLFGPPMRKRKSTRRLLPQPTTSDEADHHHEPSSGGSRPSDSSYTSCRCCCCYCCGAGQAEITRSPVWSRSR
jgi:hypothetical protein